MLFKRNRLKKRENFQRVIKEGKTLASEGIRIFWRENGLELSRFGVIVGKKVFSKAVSRNRHKRLLREALRRNLSIFRPGFDIVILLKTEVNQTSLTHLFWLFKKAGLLIKENV